MGEVTHPEASLRQLLYDVLHTLVVRAQLDLAREVEQQVDIVPELLQPVLQPVVVGLEILHAVQHTAVRPKTVFVHDIVKRYEGSDVDCAGVWNGFVRGIEVDYCDGTVQGGE